MRELLFKKPTFGWRNFTAVLNAHGDHERLLEFGLLVGHGYSFTYNGNAVVLVGELYYGKSPLVELFTIITGTIIVVVIYDSNKFLQNL
mgnify:CR=1 FL=1